MFGGSVKPSDYKAATQSSALPAQTPGHVSAGAVSNGVNPENPFRGLTIYFVGQINDTQFFQVQYPDKSFVTVDSGLLSTLGFSLTRLSLSAYRIEYDKDITFAFSKPQIDLAQSQQQNKELSGIFN